ncbi:MULTISPECIES: amino acid permease [Halorussus]|uniref:amino acid permease n=1 Tax=Halorussus TaxID=1070314 RepID=UPI000E216BB3|nr:MULTISPECIES: amino acid permease [Halorussus]NHN61368.1 amino acid permease [Halorussus sp. JP-T4]
MPKDLERDLGLYATITISIGAMIGSGIFVLPGLAAKKTGPSVIFAYLLAGLIVLPAVLSKAEMATALPEAGGTYLYIDRAMGPLLGTIAGIGAWFSLVFKSAFALVGLGAYLLLLVSIPNALLVTVSLGLGVLLVAVNVVGVKQSGRLQAVVVSLVLLALAAFILDGITYVDSTRFHPLATHDSGGVLAATGFVFVSYAGVTKIASVAEEVENPGRNIPIAMLASVVMMMFVYTLTVYVMVGVSPADDLMANDMLTPMALAASQFAGRFGELALSAVAVLALTSMANAGILSSSRFPLAMSRDSLAPERLSDVSERFKTPVASVTLTGVLLLGLIAFVPVVELAKLASAFKILIFTFINVALIAFRESSLEWYTPEFTSPAYPWVQLAGIVGGLVLLTQMGPVAIGGAVGIIVAGVLWYRVYGREKTEREGAALDAIRRTAGSRSLTELEHEFTRTDGTVLVAMDETTSPRRERTLLTVAASVAAMQNGRVYAVRFEEVPEQLSLSSATDVTETDRAFERQTRELAEDLPADIVPYEVVSHDRKRAVVNYAAEIDAELLLGEWEPDRLHAELLGSDVDWFMEHAPCETAFLRERALAEVDDVAVITRRGPHGSVKVMLANALAVQYDATIRFITAVGEDASDELVDSTGEYHRELEALCSATTRSEIVRTGDPVDGVVTRATDADVAIVGTVAHSRVHELVLGDPATEISDRLDCPVLLVHPRQSKAQSLLRRLIERVVF